MTETVKPEQNRAQRRRIAKVILSRKQRMALKWTGHLTPTTGRFPRLRTCKRSKCDNFIPSNRGDSKFCSPKCADGPQG